MPSRSRFQNLFFYYRGPTSRDPGREEAERAFDIQLEDNTTKALINVLESSAPAVTASFLTELLGEQVEADARRPFVYSLQGADPAARDADRRYLVGISMLGETGVVNEGAAEQQQSLGRVDAAIHRRNDLLIVFEAKVGSSDLQRQQLDQHAARWKIAQPERKIVRWPELYSWAERELATNRHDEVTAFLLGQLIEFLELTELAPFRGFRDDDFEFFKTLALEQRPVVKNRLAGLGQEVVSLLTEAERDAIGELHVGQLGEGADHAWLHTHEGQDIVNLTLELYAEELQVNIVGWRRDQAASMERWLLSERGQQALRILPEHDLVIYKRSAFNISRRETGARPWWQKERSVKLTQRAAHEADRAWLSGILKQFNDRSWEKPGFHIRRSWSRATVVKARETIAHHVAEELQRLLPIVTQINVAADAV